MTKCLNAKENDREEKNTYKNILQFSHFVTCPTNHPSNQFRYYAIVRPLEYPLYMTNRTVFFMLANVWLLPALISFTPIFFGWYTTSESLQWQEEHTDSCIFVANKTYAIISSSVSFWIPGFVMITMYCRIYR